MPAPRDPAFLQPPAAVDIDVLDLAHRLMILVSHGGADDGGARHVAGRIEVARRGRGRVAVGRRLAANRHAIVWHTVGRGRRPVWIGGHPRTLVTENLAAPGGGAVAVFRPGLQL